MTLISVAGSRIAYDFPDEQPASDPSVGNSGLGVHFINTGGSSVGTSAFDTTTGVLLAAVGRGVLSDFSSATVTDNASNTLAMSGTSHNYPSRWPNSGTACFFKSNATGRAGCVVSASKPSPNDEVTVLAVNVLDATQIEASSFIYDETGPTNVGTNITVTVPSVLVSVWSGDDSNGELNPAASAGWTVLQHTSSLASDHVQMAIAARTVSAGTYGITWTPSTSQGGHVYLFGIN